MNTLRKLFVILAFSCAASWLLKQVAIAAYGGFAAEGRLAVGLLWGTGMVTFLLAAAVGTALLLPRRTPAWLRAALGLVAVPVAFTAMDAVDAVAKRAYQSDGWFRDELGLVVVALVMAALAVRLLRGAGTRSRVTAWPTAPTTTPTTRATRTSGSGSTGS